jgi:hypothetical protein
MTTATPPTSSTGDAGEDLDELTALVAGQQQAHSRPRRSLWWRLGYPIALVLLVLAIPALVFVGLRVILNSTDGQLVRRVTDPAAPGYEAVLEPTPTELVVAVTPEGKLDSATILALTSDGVGGVMTVPAGTIVPSTTGSVSLRNVYDGLGAEAVASSLGQLLDLTFGETRVVPAAEWASLTGPAAPITVNNPDPVTGPTGAVLFPKGTLQLGAADVWPYISGRGTRESDLARMVRLQAFWKGWLAKIGTGGPGTLGIPTDDGFGKILLTLSGDQVQYETLPVTTTYPDPNLNEQFLGDPGAISGSVASIIPFPEGAPGARPRLRVLDGTGELDNGVSAAIVLAAAGAQIDVVGNARSFGQATTQFIYYDDAYADEAQKLRDALGVGEIVHSEQTNSATDMTVVLGEDYVAVAGSGASTAASPSTLGGQDG